jgi:hypothetical protein
MPAGAPVSSSTSMAQVEQLFVDSDGRVIVFLGFFALAGVADLRM